jgi:hypothetical protein
MRTIALTDESELLLPQDAVMLSVGKQHGRLVLWALVDDEAPKVSATVSVRGTGHSFGLTPRAGDFVGTVQSESGLVWHIFVRMP